MDGRVRQSLPPSSSGGPFYLLKTGRDVPALCAELNRDPEVEYAQPNYIYRPCRDPNDPDFADQYAHQLIQMQKAWDISTGSRDIVIAILDTGVDVNHPDLKDNIWVNKGEIPDNKKDDDGNGYVDDVHGWNFGDRRQQGLPDRLLGLHGQSWDAGGRGHRRRRQQRHRGRRRQLAVQHHGTAAEPRFHVQGSVGGPELRGRQRRPASST